MKKISVYTQGGIQSAVFRYRFYQIFQKIECFTKYNKALPDRLYREYMPIGERNIIIKTYAFLVMLFRTLFFLCYDLNEKPDEIVISRSLLKRYIPYLFKMILLYLKKKGTIIIWDFDDDIIELREIRLMDFQFMSEISEYIVIASPYLKSRIAQNFHSKVRIVSTTDGTMNAKMSESIVCNRLECYQNEVRVLWVGTSSGLKFLKQISPLIDKAGEVLNKKGKKVILTVICNEPLVFSFQYTVLDNRKWSAEVAETGFLNSHIGLMPLDDSIYSAGKGGFKLIQYMSVGLPSLASAIGVNNEILSYGAGFLIDNLVSEEWCNRLNALGDNIDLWKSLSMKALQTYSQRYSLEQNLELWKDMVC